MVSKQTMVCMTLIDVFKLSRLLFFSFVFILQSDHRPLLKGGFGLTISCQPYLAFPQYFDQCLEYFTSAHSVIVTCNVNFHFQHEIL